MKRILRALSCLLLVTALAACSPAPADNGVQPSVQSFSGRTLEVILGLGGGGNYYEPVLMRLMELHPGLNVDFTYSGSANEIVLTKSLSGSMPDIFSLNQSTYDYYAAIRQGLCLPLDSLLSMELPEGGTLQDLLNLELMETRMYDGKHYLFGEVIFLSGLWYNAALLRDCGVEPPAGWEELLSVCEALSERGIYGFGYCGQMAEEYALNYWLLPMVSTGSLEEYLRIEAIEPGAWRGEAVNASLDKLSLLREMGYCHPLSPGLSNAEAQTRFIKGEFAFLPCGSWLAMEMSDAWPEDFELSFLPYSCGDDSSDINRMTFTVLVSAVYSGTQNLDVVGEFYRLMYTDSQAIRGQIAVHRNALILRDFEENWGPLLHDSVRQCWSAAGQSMPLLSPAASNRYPEYGRQAGDCFNALMRGEMDKGQFEDWMEEVFAEFSDSRCDSVFHRMTSKPLEGSEKPAVRALSTV